MRQTRNGAPDHPVLSFSCSLCRSCRRGWHGNGHGLRKLGFGPQLPGPEPPVDEIRRLDAFRHSGKGKFGAAHVAVAAGRAHVIKTGIGKTAYIAAAVAAKDDNDSLAHNAAYGNPFETMDLGEETSRSALLISLSEAYAPPAPQSVRLRKAREKKGSQERRYSLLLMRRRRLLSA